ncbi:MAG: carboxypeptidase regulatory-like domain-containing protein [Fidelibacterota bacterium]
MNSTLLRSNKWLLGIPLFIMNIGFAQEEGAVIGFVGFAGTFPPQTNITITTDQGVCGHRILDEEFVVDPVTHGLTNVIVFWERPSEEQSISQDNTVITVSQINCRYVPHVQVGSPGAILEFVNNDGILHNVHVYDSEKETLFNLAQPGFKKKLQHKLETEDNVVSFRCDVHKWMNGYVLLLKNAAYTITDSNGQFRLEGINNGTQKIHFWHEGLGKAVRTVEIVPGEEAVLDLVIEANN